MKRGWLLNLALLAAVALLGWFAWRTPPREDLARQPLSAQKSAAVQRIVLQRPGKPEIRLERRGSQWHLTAPLAARADEFQVLRMLTVMETAPLAKLSAGDLTRYELQPPAALLSVDGIAYAFGGVNPVTREQYLLRGGEVFAVEARHGAGLPADAGALIRRTLLAETEQPVDIELPEFRVRKTDGRWQLTPPVPDIGADDLQRFADRWRQASAAKAEAYDGRPAVGSIRIACADGSTVELGVLQWAPRLLLWRRDNGLQYLFLESATRALLATPAPDGK